MPPPQQTRLASLRENLGVLGFRIPGVSGFRVSGLQALGLKV